jgi:hypothetical protein
MEALKPIGQPSQGHSCHQKNVWNLLVAEKGEIQISNLKAGKSSTGKSNTAISNAS